MQIISKKVKISTNFWKPNFLNPLCDNGYRIIVRFSENGYIFLEKTKNRYDFLEKVHFSGRYDFLAGQSTIFWKRYIFLALPKKAGAQVRIYVCAPFGND
jgi:hypothetical protein